MQREPEAMNSAAGCSSIKELQLRLSYNRLLNEVRSIILDSPNGVWCADFMKLYRERYGRELNFSRFGIKSIVSLVHKFDGKDGVYVNRPGPYTDWFVGKRSANGPPAIQLDSPKVDLTEVKSRSNATTNSEDALPGIPYDSDVFPEDCVTELTESVPALPLDGFCAGATIPTLVAQVYSPSRFWLLPVGPYNHLAMYGIMDAMNDYYFGVVGAKRHLSLAMARVGQDCCCLYLGHWHRCRIVRIIDADTVKVRHLDYGTVQSKKLCDLKPLLKRFASLPAQAVRAQLAGVRPPAAATHWPHSSNTRFLVIIKQRQFTADVVAIDREKAVLEVFLIDASTDVSAQLICEGFADRHTHSGLGAPETYLVPEFEALERAATPNYDEILEYLRAGVDLQSVDGYRRYVLQGCPYVPMAASQPDSAESQAYGGPSPSCVDDVQSGAARV